MLLKSKSVAASHSEEQMKEVNETAVEVNIKNIKKEDKKEDKKEKEAGEHR